MAALKILSNYIANDENGKLITALANTRLDQLSEENSKIFLHHLLSACATYNNTTIIKHIFISWERSFPQALGIFLDEDVSDDFNFINQPTLYTSLYYTPGYTIKELQVCARGLIHEYSPLRVLYELSLYKDVPIVAKAARLVFEVYGEQPQRTVKAALESADKKDASYLFNFLNNKYKEVAPFAEKPSWMKNFTTSPDSPDSLNLLPVETQIVIPRNCEVVQPDLTMEEALDLVTDGLSQYFEEDDIRAKTREMEAFFKIATQEQIKKFLQPFVAQRTLNNLQNDEYLYRVLGPANPFINSSVEDLQAGDYRMFNCLRFDAKENDENEIGDWFTGNCLMCLKRIRKRYYAVRRPVAGGGWIECFCSWECVRYRIAQLEEYYIGDDNSIGELEIVKAMVNIYEEQLEQVGIQDRITLQELSESPESSESSQSSML